MQMQEKFHVYRFCFDRSVLAIFCAAECLTPAESGPDLGNGSCE